MLSVPGAPIDAQQTPPAPAAPRPVRMPEPVEHRLPNGMRVVLIQKSNVPLVSAQVVIATGAEADPAEQSGLADVTATLLTKGTQTRSAQQVAEAIEALGATMSARGGWDASRVSLTVMSAGLEPALRIVSEVVRTPTFAEDELKRVVDQRQDNLKVSLRDPGSLAFMTVGRKLYGDAPYGHPAGGTQESLARLRRGDVVAFHAAEYRPDNAILVLAGDVSPETAFALAQQLFGDWKAAGAPREAPSWSRARLPARALVIDMPEAGQAAVVLAMPGLRRADPDYFTSLVTNAVLGGGFSARLNFETRIKRGLTYGAFSNFEYRQEAGPFTAVGQTKNESAAEVARIFVEELSRLAAEAVPAAEMESRKAAVIGNFARALETSSGTASQLASLALYGVDPSQLREFVSNVQGVAGADVQRFAGTRLASKDAVILVVGNSKAFIDDLRKQFPNAEVVPASELDLNSSTLRRPRAS